VSCRRHVKAAAQTDRVRMQCIVDVMQRFGMLKLRLNVSQRSVRTQRIPAEKSSGNLYTFAPP
jgi:hypothetical protein